MALIIPEAQTPFQIAAQPRLNPNAPNIGDGVAMLGDVGVEIISQKKKAETDRMVREARLTAIEGLDELRFKYETDTNLEGLTDRWETEARAVAEGVGANLPAYLRKDFSLSMREMVGPQTSAIRRREYALFQDREGAALNADLRRFEKAAANAPTDDARSAVYAEAGAVIGAAVDSGILSAVQADAMMADLPANTEQIAALGMIENDPQGYLEMADEGAFANLPPATAAEYKRAATRNMVAEDVRATRQAELDAKVAERQLADETDTAISIIESGLKYDALPELLDRTKGTASGDRLRGALDVTETAGNFALLPPTDQDAQIAALEAAATGNPSDVAKINRLRTLRENTAKSLADDALAHVRDRRIIDIEPVDIADPASVRKRIAQAESVYSTYTPDAQAIRYFDKAEAEQYTAILNGPDVDRSMAVLTAITNNYGDRAGAAFAQLGATDPTLQLAGALVTETGQIAASRTLLQGRAMKAKGEGAAVSAEVRREIAAELAPLYPPADRGRLQTLIAAAEAHYAASGIGIADPKSAEAAEAMRASVQAVAAGTTQGGVQYGGIQEVNGKPAVLPPNLTAGKIEEALTYFDATAWTRASATGNPPLWGKKPVHEFQPENREDLTVLSLGQGLYALGYQRADGSILYMKDPAQQDGLFRFDLQSLVTGVSGQ